jgi:integrase
VAAGLPNIGWHSLRHTVSAWGKEAGLELEQVKTLLRHENIVTTSNVYCKLGLDAKRRIQHRLVEFVKQQAVDEASKHTSTWQQTPPVTIQ